MSIAEPQAQMQTARRNHIPRGIAYMVASTVMFAGVNANVKWELQTYPISEVAFFRSLFAFTAVAAKILPPPRASVLRSARVRGALQRGLSAFRSLLLIFLAFPRFSARFAAAIPLSSP